LRVLVERLEPLDLERVAVVLRAVVFEPELLEAEVARRGVAAGALAEDLAGAALVRPPATATTGSKPFSRRAR
jgi:hypothetical protein